MRPIFLTFLITPILRSASLSASIATARRLPPLIYPVCHRNRTFSCSASPYAQIVSPIMADINAEMSTEAEGLAEAAAPCGSQNAAREKTVEEKKKTEEKAEEKLPKLSAAEFRAYNSMAEHMEYFHNHFRQSWTLLHSACVSNKRPANVSLKQFISIGLQFISHLSTHHSIEEQHVFPVLATKMPEFKAGKNAAELLRQHREIHAGMDVFEDYLLKCRSGETELELRVLKEKMDSWGEVLWKHLDQEVKTLGAENMRKYWTIDEIRRMPM